jgi:hypothetical protein
MNSRLRVRLVSALTVLVAAATALLVTPTAGHAAVEYWYKPSYRLLNSANQFVCTGAWGIRNANTNEPFYLTAGHCFGLNAAVYSDYWDRSFGTVRATFDNSTSDSARIRPAAGVDGWQEIPGIGKTVGKRDNTFATGAGNGVGMLGGTSGLTYGTILGGWYTYPGWPWVSCTTYARAGGDSGAPVFIHYGNQVYAVGMHIGSLLIDGVWRGCFIPLDDLLVTHQAYLPVFPEGTQLAGPAATINLGPSPDGNAPRAGVVATSARGY